jgi:hypothetical protein
MTQDRWDKVDRKVLDDIAREGWAAISVFPTTASPGHYFTYTVGLGEHHHHPDLIVVGMTPEVSHGVLNAAYQAIQGGTRFEPDTYSTEVLVGLRVAVLEVLEPLGALPMSMCQHLFGRVSGLQLVWPDTEDRFPWDDDFEERFRDRQPRLGIWSGS